MNIKTIKGRWEECKKQLPADLPKAEEVRMMLTFYAGFAACLEFNMEVSELHEMEAMVAFAQITEEANALAAAAQRIFVGRPQ